MKHCTKKEFCVKGFSGFDHIYWRNPQWNSSFSCSEISWKFVFFFALLTLHKISRFIILDTWTNFTNSRNEVSGKTIVYDCKLLYNLSPKAVVEFLAFRPISENNEIQNDTKIKFKNIVLLQIIKRTNEWMDKFLNFILTFK